MTSLGIVDRVSPLGIIILEISVAHNTIIDSIVRLPLQTVVAAQNSKAGQGDLDKTRSLVLRIPKY